MSDASQFLIPRGLRFGATKAGLKKSGRPDFALIAADRPATALPPSPPIASPPPPHRGQAAPPRHRQPGARGRHQCRQRKLRRGEAGLAAARANLRRRRTDFRLSAEQVFPSSTGIIGVPLPAEKLIAALPTLAASLGSEFDHFLEVAQAILTTTR